MKNSLHVFFKLLASSVLILVIGFAFLAANPKKEVVNSAKADIYSFAGLDTKNNFKRAMESLGIRGRAYDFNGNTMYFGTNRVYSDSAEETAQIVQEALIAAGVNKKNYLNYRDFSATYVPSRIQSKARLGKALDFRKAMLSGEMVPIKKTNTRIEMSAITTTEGGILNVSENENVRSLSERLNGYRYLEINQAENARHAEIIAVWTDDNFNAGKMANQDGVQQSGPDFEIPACIGCKRVRRVQALDESEPYNMNKWQTPSQVDEIYNFYKQTMGNRGWKESGRQKKLNILAKHFSSLRNIRGRALAMEKDGKVMKITILPKAKGGAEVFSLEQYNDTQTILNTPTKEPHKEETGILGLFE